MARKAADVTIKGLSALLMHRFPLEPIEAIEKKTKEEQAEISAYRDTVTRELYVPGVNIQQALISAALYSKGKGRASLQKPIAACVLVTPERLLLGRHEYEIDSRAVVMPSTKGRIVRHRPRIEDWKLSFTVEWDGDLVTEDQMRRVIDDACSRVGFLDFRPEKKGPFGRAIVVEWKMN